RAGTGADDPIVPVPREDAMPVSFAQERMWFLQQLDPASSLYGMPSPQRIRGPVDLDVLRRAYQEVVRRHEPLRTVFGQVNGQPVQRILPHVEVALPVVDLTHLAEDQREREAQRLVAEDVAAPFDLERGPLFRATLLRVADDDWALLLAVHHVVSDGWSTGIMAGELSTLYTAFSRGEEPRLPPLPVQYADYAAWQRAWLAGETLERQLGWWRERLAGAPPLLEVPTDRPRPPVQGTEGAHRELALPAKTVAALRGLTRRGGATLFMTLLAGWQALLARYSGQDDVVVGTPIAGRGRVETEGLIGCFVNTLALRVDLAGRPTARELLARVRETALGAYAHQEIPFEKLVEELQPERSLAYTPLFQSLFALQNAGRGDLRLGDLETESLGTAEPPAKFDLSLALAEDGGALRGALGYRVELWDGATAGRMLAHYAALLEGMAAEPERPVATIPLLSAAELDELLAAPDRSAREHPSGLCIHEMVDAQLRRAPDSVAVVSAGARLTLAELDREADRVARLLRAAGVGPEVRVGIFLQRTPTLVAALLGVLRAGGAYVPLDPAYPAERLRYMLEDSGARVLLTEEGLRGRLPEFGGEVVLAPSMGENDGSEAWTDVVSADRAPTPDSLAFIIYTSGSTGRPKGVAVRHRSAAAMLSWAAETFPAEERAGILASTSICFDISVFEIFLPLAAGGTAVLARNVLQLRELAAAHPVTLVNTVPSAWAELLRAGAVPPTVATVNLAGEPLPAALARDTHALGHVRRVLNLYGPSEDTVYSTWAEVEPDDPAPPIGRPLPGTRGYVLDAELQPVPPGVRGELYLSGDGLARGYLGRPDLTAGRWLPDPFGGAGERMYRTGDRVRRRPDGTLDFLGRTDHQVKVRGFRIEPGEVEAVLAAHPAVREAAVVAREDVPGDRRLVGYYVPAAETSDAELRDWLRARLPEHMVPSALVRLVALPLTPSGKTDRRALPAPAGGTGEGYAAPRDAVETGLVSIWEEVLRRSPVGVHDDFFALGGHSLLVMQVVARVRTAFGVELPVPALFEKPTVAALAAAVAELAAGGAQPRRVGPIRRADRAGRTLRDPG
ncbi:MAG TPA: amino acid adenylation domain-containing protein, partial [Longimicrobiaceae bacterium]|nr:amino acid adenylation domain-containing protein [Longimicrobiaceae bacterium]